MKKIHEWISKRVKKNGDAHPHYNHTGQINNKQNNNPPPQEQHKYPQQSKQYHQKHHHSPIKHYGTSHKPTAKKGPWEHKTGPKMRIIPLGGLEEVGKNITAIEYGNDIVVIDAGMSFAGPEMLGVDYIVPDVSYLEQKKHNVRAVIFTHGHLDHIGAAQYIVPKLGNPPLYASKLTAGLLLNRLKEFALDKSVKLNEYNENTKLKLGAFEAEFFRVNHSIPDGMGLFLKSPVGSLVHTGDFKFDHSPAMDKPTDMQRIAELGKRGVDVLMIDSTNAMKPGFCASEKKIGENLEDIIAKTKGRLIIASFSSLIGRIDQLCNIAGKYNRKVFLSGRSMVENMALAERIGYTTYPKGSARKISPQVNSLPPSQVIILTTGAQGETMSALTRMAIGEHAHIKIREGDTVVISASPIPGNELAISKVINNLYALGAKVITNGQMDVHVSGHAHAEEVKIMYSLIKPKCYVPIHGETFMRIGHAEMIKRIAEPSLQITLLENNGDVLEVSKQGIRKSKQKIPANDILVDGLGFGDIGSRVIQDRKIMSTDGMLLILFQAYDQTRRLVCEPDIISRGFLYVQESQEIASETKQVAKKAFEQIIAQNKKIGLKDLKRELAMHISRFIRKRLGREPMILPIIMYI